MGRKGHMQRRDFIAVLGGAAAWPLGARAQQPAMPVIGFLDPGSPEKTRVNGFRQALADAGYVEGRNVAIEFRWANTQLARLRALAEDLVTHRVLRRFSKVPSPPTCLSNSRPSSARDQPESKSHRRCSRSPTR